MENKSGNWIFRITGLFIVVTGLSVAFHEKLLRYDTNTWVIAGANAVLFLSTFLNLRFQEKNLNNPNPSAVIRGVMAGTFLKLFVLAAAAIIYLIAAGAGRSVNAIFAGMGLYIIYTWFEVRISLQMKPKK